VIETDSETPRPSHNARGFFVDGPQMVNPSDVLAKMITEAQGTLDQRHFAPNLVEQARIARRNRLQRQALRRKYASHGVSDLVRLMAR
jgi:hypothetical protein